MTDHRPKQFLEMGKQVRGEWAVSDRLLDPVLLITKEEDYVVRLAGSRMVNGEKRIILAESIEHNWVADGTTIRPLPKDTPELVKEMLAGVSPEHLRFVDVIRLLRTTDPSVPVEADDSVFRPASVAANALGSRETTHGLNGALFPYQASGVAWMAAAVRHTGGVLLADEMGLGKTVQVIALILHHRPESTRPALILCPTTLITNWIRELARFAPQLSVLVHRGSSRTGVTSGLQRADIVLATYDTLINDLSIFSPIHWTWVICDEAQALKNPRSLRRRAVSSLKRQFTLPVTGTPVETSLLDLWSLVDLAIPTLFGGQREFLALYPDSEMSARRVSQLVDPIVLRRSVAEVATELPPRVDIDLPISLGPILASRYQEVLRETLATYAQAGPLVATGQLQLFCAHPWLQFTGKVDDDDEASCTGNLDLPLVTPKLEQTVSLLAEVFSQKKKVLIFSHFNRCYDLIKQASGELPAAFWGAINGSTPQENRQEVVDQFSEYDGPGCLVLNPKAAGAGINITAATVVIHYTQSWNPALEAQASARVHRRGQTEPVFIYRLFYEDTVERVMVDRAAWRRIIGNEAVPISSRDDQDFARALSLLPNDPQ
jgi:SNF2 family DNA or RNA helicase